MVGYAPTALYCIESRGKYMNNIQIFNNPEFGEIRTMIIDDEPWFVSKDISDKLGYAKPANMVKLVDDDDKRNVRSSDLEPSSKGTVYQVSMINESGLYAAIFGSKQENAKKFKKWVTSEVLPSIRKTGTYSNTDIPKESIPVGEVARLSTVMDRVMVRQNSKPHDIARAFEMLCGQFGIMLPDNFVNVPEYEQMTLMNI